MNPKRSFLPIHAAMLLSMLPLVGAAPPPVELQDDRCDTEAKRREREAAAQTPRIPVRLA